MSGPTNPRDLSPGHGLGPGWLPVERHDWDGGAELDVTLLEVLWQTDDDLSADSRQSTEGVDSESLPTNPDEVDLGPPLYPSVDTETVTAVLDSVPDGVTRAVVRLTVRGRPVAITSDGVVAVRTRDVVRAHERVR